MFAILTAASCHAKEVIQFGKLLRENILLPIPQGKQVFNIPIIPHKFFLYNRNLLSKLSRAAENLRILLRAALGLKNDIFDTMMTILISGDYTTMASAHPCHCCADVCFVETGYIMWCLGSIKAFGQLFRAKGVTILRKACYPDIPTEYAKIDVNRQKMLKKRKE